MAGWLAGDGRQPIDRAREFVAILAESALTRELAPGDFAHLEGDDAETVSVVLDGQLVLESYPPSSWLPALIGVVGPGQLIGEEALGGGDSLRTSSVRALTVTRLKVIYGDELLALIAGKERARRLFFAMVADRVRLSGRSALANSATSVDVRIVRWLLHMHAVFADGADSCPDIAATQEQLAGLAGTRRPTANKTLQALQREGLIAIGRGRIQITDVVGLGRWLDHKDPDAI